MLSQVIEDGEIVSSYAAPIQYDYLISDAVLYLSSGSVYITNINYEKGKTFTLTNLYPQPSTIRIAFSMRRGGAPGAVWGRIYKNGGAIGTPQTTDSTTPVTYVEDISFTQGDTLEFWGKAPTGNQCVLNAHTVKGTLVTRPVKGLKIKLSIP